MQYNAQHKHLSMHIIISSPVKLQVADINDFCGEIHGPGSLYTDLLT